MNPPFDPANPEEFNPLNWPVVFIDEFCSSSYIVYERIRFLRNLCRLVHIPVILSGTNSKVDNLIGKSDSDISGRSNRLKLSPSYRNPHLILLGRL